MCRPGGLLTAEHSEHLIKHRQHALDFLLLKAPLAREDDAFDEFLQALRKHAKSLQNAITASSSLNPHSVRARLAAVPVIDKATLKQLTDLRRSAWLDVANWPVAHEAYIDKKRVFRQRGLPSEAGAPEPAGLVLLCAAVAGGGRGSWCG